jgi:acyl-coenzyme A synthetase/AMP-(fatty) acid ligase
LKRHVQQPILAVGLVPAGGHAPRNPCSGPLNDGCVERVPGVREGAVIALSVPGRETERLIVLAECETPRTAAAVAGRIHHTVARELGLSVADAVLVRPFSLPKTTSGKLERARAKALYLAGRLEPIGAQSSEV